VDSVQHLSQLRQHIEDLELLEQFSAEIRLTGFYDEDSMAEESLEEAVSSRPMRQFSDNTGAQDLIRYLHRREKLSSRARFEPHEMSARLPWKQLKTHPDNIMMFIGPNGIAAAKPTADPERRDLGLARGDQDRPGDTQLVYDVYYNLNDADGITVEKYTTTRGGLPDKRDQRNPDNIADFIRDRLGVRGRFNAIYIAGRYTMGGEERMADPEKEQALQSVEKSVPNWDKTGRQAALQKSSVSTLFRGRRSTGVTEPGHSVERLKGTIRGLRGDAMVQLADRLLRIMPNLIRQAKVKMTRSGMRDQAKTAGEPEYHSPGDKSSQLVRWISYTVVPELQKDVSVQDQQQAQEDFIRDQLKFVLKNNDDIEASVKDKDFVPAFIATDADRKRKFERLRSTIDREAYYNAQRKSTDQMLQKAVQGDTQQLEKVVNVIRDRIYNDLST
jgi:hypothetical protein